MKFSLLKSNIVLDYLVNFLKHDRGSCLFFFLVGLTLRGIPELLVPSYPVGYETIVWYASPLMTFLGRSVIDVFVEFFRSGPLFYVLMWLAANVTGVHAFVILKVVGPLLYGGLIVSFFVFLKRGLKFEWKMAFVASLLLVFQIAALRDSWDRFRTVLGLVFLFGGLTALKSDGKHKLGLLAVFGLLVVLSREYVALVLFVSVLGFMLLEKKSDKLAPLLALVPALFVFLVMVVPLLSVSWTAVVEMEFASRSYLWVVRDAFVIFVICYVLLLPFVLLGWRRDKLVGSMVVWLLVGSFSIVGGPLFSVPGYQRWLMLLVFPFCVYAVWGFERLRLFSGRRVWMLAAVMLGFVIVGAGYSTGVFSYMGWVANSYVAVDLVESSIRWDQVNDVKTVLAWLDGNAVSNSSVLTEESFWGWTLLYLRRANEDVRVVPYGAASPPSSVLERVARDGFSRIYLIWYTQSNFSDFQVVYSQNSISIFQYLPCHR